MLFYILLYFASIIAIALVYKYANMEKRRQIAYAIYFAGIVTSSYFISLKIVGGMAGLDNFFLLAVLMLGLCVIGILIMHFLRKQLMNNSLTK